MSGAAGVEIPRGVSMQWVPAMVITLDPELKAALVAAARQRGVAPEALALETLRGCFLTTSCPPSAGRMGAPAPRRRRQGLRRVALECHREQ